MTGSQVCSSQTISLMTAEQAERLIAVMERIATRLEVGLMLHHQQPLPSSPQLSLPPLTAPYYTWKNLV